MVSKNTYNDINEVFLLGDDIDRQVLAQFALTVRQYHLLNWLHKGGQASLTELAKLLLCDKSNVTGIVRRLKAAKLIEEIPKSDRRFTTVRLTEAGHTRHDAAEIALKSSINRRFAAVNESEHLEIQRLLTQLHSHLRTYIDTCLPSELANLRNPKTE